MSMFAKRADEILEGLKPIKYSPILRGISKVLGAPRKLDSALTAFARGEMDEPVGYSGTQKKSGAIEPEYSDLEKELILVMKKLRLNPGDTRLQRRVEEIRQKLLKK